MKKFLSWCLTLSLILSTMMIVNTNGVYAEETETELEWSYEMFTYDGGTEDTADDIAGVAVTEYLGSQTDMYVPANIDVNGTDLPVLKLGNSLFKNKTGINSVTLSSNIKVIGESAFEGATDLVCIVTNEGLATIEANAFKGCTAFNSVILYDAVTSIGENAFEGCTNLTIYCNGNTPAHNYAKLNSISFSLLNVNEEPVQVDIDGIGYVIANGQVFVESCPKNTVGSITIPATVNGYPVTTIAQAAFKYCNVTEIIMPDSIKIIGGEAFSSCDELLNIKISASLENIGVSAFAYCYKLAQLILPQSVKSIGDRAFGGCNELEYITIPDKAEIGEGLFSNCKSLKNAWFPEGIEEIKKDMFMGCLSLENVIIPDTVMHIGENAFRDCENLSVIELPENLASIGVFAFGWCAKLTYVDIPDGVTVIPESAFYHCSGLVSVEFPENLSEIGERAFYDCAGISEVELPDSLVAIGENAFYGCAKIEELTIPAGAFIYQNSFPSATVLNVYENSYAKAMTEAYEILHNVKSEVFELDVKYAQKDKMIYRIENNEACLIDCADIKIVSATIPATVNGCQVTKVEGAFEELHSLQSVVLPEGLKIIGEKTFYFCTALTSVIIPESVTTIGSQAFICEKLKSLTLGDNITSIADYVFPSQFTREYEFTIYCNEKSTAHRYAIAKDVDYSLLDVEAEQVEIDGITYLIENDNVKVISCAEDLSGSVVIPETVKGHPVTYIGPYSFKSDYITDVTIGGNVERIGADAFGGCSRIKSVAMSDSVKDIGDGAFNACFDLTDITLSYNLEAINARTFYGCYNLGNITIPKNVKKIGARAFENCRRLTSVTIPENVTIIEEYAFYGCESLKNTNLPKKLEYIGRRAFMGCSKLERLTVPDSIEVIEERVFDQCNSLKLIVPESVKTINVNSFSDKTFLYVYEDSYVHKFAETNGFLYYIMRKTENPDISHGSGISGAATYTDGSVVSNATVDILYDDGMVKESVTTDENGAYSFTYAEVGRYTIRVTDVSGNVGSETISVKRMNVFDVYIAGETDIAVKNSYTVAGRVDPEGSATVTLTDTDGNIISTKNTTDGAYTFENVPNGTYIIKAESETGSVVKEVTVFGGDVTVETLVIAAESAAVTGYVEVMGRDGSSHRRNWVQVTIYDSEGIATASQKSDADGKYIFANLPMGDYSIVAEAYEMRPDKKKGFERLHTITGYAYVSVTEVKTYELETIVLYEENDCEASISGKVTAQGEPQICEVILSNVFRHEIARYETKNNGKYTFKNVYDGLYFIIAITQSDGMGFAVVVVREGEVYGETDIFVRKADKIKQHEEKMKSIPYCESREDALKYKDEIKEEKEFYDGLSKKEKKQLSEEYIERLSRLVEYISGCEYEENGGKLSGGGMIISGDEIENEEAVTLELNITETEATEISDDGIKTDDEFVQQSIEDATGDRQLCKYYDITLSKNGKNISNISKQTDTTGKLRITMDIPEEYRGHKHYSFVHVHNGIVTTLVDLDNNPDTVTFEIDKFSTFALTFTDEELTDEVTDDASVELSDDGTKIVVTSDISGTLYIASYGEGGKLAAVATFSIKAGTTEALFDIAENQKAFLWDENFAPLCIGVGR